MQPQWLASLAQDGRCAFRSVAAHPRRPVAVVALLGLAIGIATAMFTIVDALILRPVPFHNPNELAHLHMGDERGGPGSVSPAVFRAWRESAAFAAVEAATTSSALVGAEGTEVVRNVARVTPGMFDLLGGVSPVRGRLFSTGEGQTGGGTQILISEDIWRSLYGADESLVGRTLTIDGAAAVVVGILPSNFRFPSWNTLVWTATSFDRPEERPVAYVRFARTMPHADALGIATRAAHEAGVNARWRAHARAIAASLDDYYATAVPMLSGGVVLLFAVLCANVASLLLANLTSRAREFGTRTALGASRGRLIRQAFLETALLGAAGAAAGTALAWWLVSSARTVLPEAAFIRSLNTLDLDMRALAVASITGLLATAAVGVLPAAAGTRVDVIRLLQTAGRTTSSGRARVVTRGLLACQVALSCTLVFGATLLVRSFVKLVNEDRVIDVRNTLKADVRFPSASLATPESTRAVEDAARALPGITEVAWSYGTPPGGGVTHAGEWTPDSPDARPVTMQVYQFIVDEKFLRLYRVPILRGRSFTPSDDWSAVMVSERFARALWPDQDPIGRLFTFASGRFRVVGVVGDIRYPSLDRALDAPQIYSLFKGASVLAMLSLRCGGPCPDTVYVRKQLTAALPRGTVSGVVSPETSYVREFVRPRAAAVLAFAFAITALVAAATGLFCLLSENVAARRREFGIRTALGATPRHVRRLVWSDGLSVTVLGIAAGAFGSVLLTHVLSSLLLDVSVADPVSWMIVAATMAAAIAAATWHPTRTAVRATPVALLREE